MRYLFFLLLTLNVAFAVVQLMQEGPNQKGVTESQPGDALAVAGNPRQDQAGVASDRVEADEPTPAPEASQAPTSSSVADGDPGANDGSPPGMKAIGLEVSPESGTREAGGRAAGDDQGTDEGSAAPEDADKQLGLQGPTGVRSAPVAQAENATALMCFDVGPFEVRERAAELLREMQPVIETGDVATRQVVIGSVYWVHVVPQATAEDARNVVRALAAKGIESFVINEQGDLQRGISLGVFHDPDSAERLRSRMQGIGYPVRVHESQRLGERYLLRVRGNSDSVAVLLKGPESRAATLARGASVTVTHCPEPEIAGQEHGG